MSICVLVKVVEALVLAADSVVPIDGTSAEEGVRSTPSGILKVYFTATRVFQLRDSPVGALACGTGTIQARAVVTFVEEFENSEWGSAHLVVCGVPAWRQCRPSSLHRRLALVLVSP